jgi:hypothetical protein
MGVLTVALAQTGCIGATGKSKLPLSSNQTTTGVTPGANLGGGRELSVSQSSMPFGNVPVGTASSYNLALSNIGSADLAISNIALSGSGFNASGISSGTILGPGQTATLNVAFSPAATGNASGTLKISSNAAQTQTSVELSGVGVQATSHSVGLVWQAGTSSIAGYNVYRATVGGAYSKLTPAQDAGTSFTDSNVQAGQTYYYAVTEVDTASVESSYSNIASVTIPTP